MIITTASQTAHEDRSTGSRKREEFVSIGHTTKNNSGARKSQIRSTMCQNTAAPTK